MEPNKEPVRGDEGAASEAGPDIRATIDWYFGDLVDDVVAERAVSHEQLVGALATLEREARSRREQLVERGEEISTAGAPGEVLAVPVGTFQVLTRACGLSDGETDAVRSLHRRMAIAVARVPEDEPVDTIVFAAEPTDLH